MPKGGKKGRRETGHRPGGREMEKKCVPRPHFLFTPSPRAPRIQGGKKKKRGRGKSGKFLKYAFKKEVDVAPLPRPITCLGQAWGEIEMGGEGEEEKGGRGRPLSPGAIQEGKRRRGPSAIFAISFSAYTGKKEEKKKKKMKKGKRWILRSARRKEKGGG